MQMHHGALWALGASLCLAACGGSGSAAYAPENDQVAVTGGTVAASSLSSATLRVFKGIPFAAPPVGELRWKAPQPVASWSSVRPAESFGNACVAGNRPAGKPGAILYQDPGPQSEDCLYLNVWSPVPRGASEKAPVMVLLYGGGYQLGAASQGNYNGAGLAAKGAVVVTLNYRLGALGFLAHPELTAEGGGRSGNYALLDAIAGLRWVQDNIGRFGGDASRVTVFSQSAGSGLAHVLMASPKAQGLFHRMVLSSLGSMPAGSNTTTLAQAEAAGTTFATAQGAANLAALRARTAADIMSATFAAGPIVDGDVLTGQIDQLTAAGKIADVPLLLGWNADEGTPYPPFATTLAAYDTTAATRYGAMAAQFKAAYPVASDADVLAMAYSPMRDNLFAWQPWTIARAQVVRARSPVWLYHFDRRPAYFDNQKFTEQDPPSRYGAYHSLEQVYFYNNLDVSVPSRPYAATDRSIAETASSYLVNFAATGNPNGGNLPAWPAFTGPASKVMRIGDVIAPMDAPNRAGLDFFDAFYAQQLGRPLPF